MAKQEDEIDGKEWFENSDIFKRVEKIRDGKDSTEQNLEN